MVDLSATKRLVKSKKYIVRPEDTGEVFIFDIKEFSRWLNLHPVVKFHVRTEVWTMPEEKP